MTAITFQESPVSLSGQFPKAGDKAHNFLLCTSELSDISLSSFKGKTVVLNIFPSIDTPVCAVSVRAFNEQAASLDNTQVLCVSADLPFATGRFCEAEGIENVKMVSFFRAPEFTEAYGVNLNDGALRGFAARAVIVINPEGMVTYSELVSEITNEPNYERAISAVGQIQ